MHAGANLRLAIYVAVLGLTLLTGPGFSHAKGKPTPALYEARTLESELALRVFVVVERGDPTPECILGTRRLLGTTPSAAPLEIPKSLVWFVEPVDLAIEDDALPAIAKEMKRASIPGLSLDGCRKLTGRTMKSFAGSKNLAYLSIRGTEISSNGMAKLKKLSALRFLDARPGALMGLEWAKKFTALEIADLSGHRTLQGPELKSLRGLKRLHTLRLNHLVFLNDRGLDHLARLTQLRELELGYCRQVTAEGIAELSKMKALEAICVDGIQIDDATLAMLSAMPSMVSIRMRGTHAVTNAGLEHLAKMTKLRHLDLRSCLGLTDAGIGHLKTLGELESLSLLASRGITDKSLAFASSLRALKHLEMSYTQITDEGMPHVAKLTKLRVLKLHKTGISDQGLSSLKACTDLRELDLSACVGVADHGLESLTELPLERLDLGETSVGGLGLAHVGSISSLKHLSLAKAQMVGDDGVKELAGLQQLDSLDLSGVEGITDASVKHLSKLKSLRTLKVVDSAITVRGARTLSEALPRCRIER